MKVLIIGGGIGGFATALSLHAVGVECEVFEQSRDIRELGVGINLLSHATKELAELGLLQALERVAIRTYDTNTRCAIETRSRAGHSAGWRCWAMPRIPCIRSARTERVRRSSTRVAWRHSWPRRKMWCEHSRHMRPSVSG
jgi:hypothetical protein